MKPHSAKCPTCGQVVASRDGQMFNAHYVKLTDTKPCVMSFKPILIEHTIFAAVPEEKRDLHHSMGVEVSEVLAGIKVDLGDD